MASCLRSFSFVSVFLRAKMTLTISLRCSVMWAQIWLKLTVYLVLNLSPTTGLIHSNPTVSTSNHQRIPPTSSTSSHPSHSSRKIHRCIVDLPQAITRFNEFVAEFIGPWSFCIQFEAFEGPRSIALCQIGFRKSFASLPDHQIVAHRLRNLQSFGQILKQIARVTWLN